MKTESKIKREKNIIYNNNEGKNTAGVESQTAVGMKLKMIC